MRATGSTVIRFSYLVTGCLELVSLLNVFFLIFTVSDIDTAVNLLAVSATVIVPERNVETTQLQNGVCCHDSDCQKCFKTGILHNSIE